MPVPKRKIGRSRRNTRRAHDFLVRATWGKCSHCGELKRPHCVCTNCGHYDKRMVKPPKEEI